VLCSATTPSIVFLLLIAVTDGSNEKSPPTKVKCMSKKTVSNVIRRPNATRLLAFAAVGSLAIPAVAISSAAQAALPPGCEGVVFEVQRLQTGASFARQDSANLESRASSLRAQAAGIQTSFFSFDTSPSALALVRQRESDANYRRNNLTFEASSLEAQARSKRNEAISYDTQAQARQAQCQDVPAQPAPASATTVASQEAEAAQIVVRGSDENRRLFVESRFGGYSGSGYVAGWNSNSQWVDFTVKVPKAGRYNVNFRYAAEGDASRSIFVNGYLRVDNLEFRGTSAYTNYATASASVDLAQGDNTISLVFYSPKGSRNWMNLDRLDVTTQ
jgi:hypothetical protein